MKQGNNKNMDGKASPKHISEIDYNFLLKDLGEKRAMETMQLIAIARKEQRIKTGMEDPDEKVDIIN
jgi:hypothetical protein